MARTLLALLLLATGTMAVWPTPKALTIDGRDARHEVFTADDVFPKDSLRLASDVTYVTDSPSLLLAEGLLRHRQHAVARMGPAAAALSSTGPVFHTVRVIVADDSETLSVATRYDYTLTVTADGIEARGATVYAALYALETLTQLVGRGGLLPARVSLDVHDAPDYAWRGLMADAGRRFFPMPLLFNLLDTMAANKLNVLHLHASDMCRFGVESTAYPALTASLTGLHAGFYTHTNISALVKYATARGIRVVPEFDVPGHSRGFLPLNDTDVDFCSSDATASQLYNDPAGKTLNTIISLFKEMAQLFPDEFFHIGCDETSIRGRCPLNSTFSFERAVLDAVTKMGKTPVGWEEVYFTAQAATNVTVVDAWSHHTPGEITSTGRRAIESAGSHFYFTSPGPQGPAGWSKCWYDIGTGVPASQKSLLLGGEMSMWSDNYCYISQCGASTGTTPPGHELFSPDRDIEFGKSIGGMIWPRGYVAAGSFWNFDNSTDPASAAFVKQIDALNDELASRGSLVCPSNCSCDEVSACGKPYITPSAPVVGSILAVADCAPEVNLGQAFDFTNNGAAVLRANRSLCISATSTGSPRLALCGSANSTLAFGSGSTLVFKASGECLDLDISAAAVDQWVCGTDQPNQAWAYDAVRGLFVSESHYDGDADKSSHAGQCITATTP